MKKLSIALVTLFLLTASASLAQSDYKAAVGVRVGTPTSASFKAFLFPAGAIEVHAGFWHYANYYNFFSTGIMYQHHFPIGNVEGLRWYLGGGVLAEFYSYDKDRWNYNNEDRSKTGIGIHAVGGVDYKFSRIPLNVSADFMPTYLIGDNLYYNFRPYGGVSARYVIK
jgi:hypothetical protein